MHLKTKRGLLPTSVVGSYAVPEWLERAKSDYFQRRISGDYLDQIHDVVVKAAIKDQELAGVDVITDGELRRDNPIDYFAVRLPGVEIDQFQKAYFYDFYTVAVRHAIPLASLGLVRDFQFAREMTDRVVKFSITGPHALARRIRNEHYRSTQAFAEAIARVLNAELRALVAAGAQEIQIDELYLAGFPEDVAWVVELLNQTVADVDAHIALHVCYGNRYGKPQWEGSYAFLFPAVLDLRIPQLTLEFARRGYDDLELFRQYPNRFELGLGVVDVKSPEVESPALVAERIRRALTVVPAERLWVNPDCGLRHAPADVALPKLKAMVEGARIVRAELAAGRTAPVSQSAGSS